MKKLLGLTGVLVATLVLGGCGMNIDTGGGSSCEGAGCPSSTFTTPAAPELPVAPAVSPDNLTYQWCGPDDRLLAGYAWEGSIRYDSNRVPVEGDMLRRQWADSVSVPLPATAQGDTWAAIVYNICHNPTVGEATGQALISLFPYITDPDQNPWLADFYEYVNQDGLNWAIDWDVSTQGAVLVSETYRWFANGIVELISQGKTQGVVADQVSAANWHLPNPVAYQLPRARVNETTEESLPAYLVSFSLKGYEGCPPTIGWNILDSRPEIFTCQAVCPSGTDKAGQVIPTGSDQTWCTNPPPQRGGGATSSTTGRGTSGGSSSGGGGGQKVCPPDKPHGTWPNCKDRPSNDPGARGNANTGGGRNANPGPGAANPDPGSAPGSAYVAPSAPEPSSPPRTVPAQPPEPGVGTGEVPVDPPPGW